MATPATDKPKGAPIDTAELRAALAAGADIRGGSAILAARLMAAAARIR